MRAHYDDITSSATKRFIEFIWRFDSQIMY
jgi:hypothetical protein